MDRFQKDPKCCHLLGLDIVIVGEVKYPDPAGLPVVELVGQGTTLDTNPVTVSIIANVLDAADFPEFVRAGFCAVVSATMYVPFANTPILFAVVFIVIVATFALESPIEVIGDLSPAGVLLSSTNTSALEKTIKVLRRIKNKYLIPIMFTSIK